MCTRSTAQRADHDMIASAATVAMGACILWSSCAVQVPEVERPEHEDDPNVYCRALPGLVPEEQTSTATTTATNASP